MSFYIILNKKKGLFGSFPILSGTFAAPRSLTRPKFLNRNFHTHLMVCVAGRRKSCSGARSYYFHKAKKSFVTTTTWKEQSNLRKKRFIAKSNKPPKYLKFYSKVLKIPAIYFCKTTTSSIVISPSLFISPVSNW